MSHILEVCSDLKKNFMYEYRQSSNLGKAARVVGLGVLTLGTIGLAARVSGVGAPLVVRPFKAVCGLGWNIGSSLVSRGLQVVGFGLGSGAGLVKDGFTVITEKAPGALIGKAISAGGKAEAVVASPEARENIAAAAGGLSKAIGYARSAFSLAGKALDALDKNVLAPLSART